MQILAIDVGTGTQDILLFDTEKEPENALKMVMPSPTALPPSVQIENDCHEPQGWNNCGPATLAMVLRFYGWTGDQYAVALGLLPMEGTPEETARRASSATVSGSSSCRFRSACRRGWRACASTSTVSASSKPSCTERRAAV